MLKGCWLCFTYTVKFMENNNSITKHLLNLSTVASKPSSNCSNCSWSEYNFMFYKFYNELVR